MTEKEMRKMLENSMDKDILSDTIINNPDRDITPVIIECYTNLNDTFLAGYSVDIVNQQGQFRSEWKEHIQKATISENLVNSADISNMENAFYELKLKYIIRPDIVKDEYKVSAIDKTIADFEKETEGYQFKNSTLIEELKRRREFYINNPYVKTKYTVDDEEGFNSLFIEEQSVIIPMLHKTRKYKIDGYNYYGVYNDARGSYITSDGKFSFKITRRGKAGAYFIKINKYKVGKNVIERLDALHFGNEVNPFFILCADPVKSVPMEEIIPKTGNELFDKVLENTYRHAIELEERGERPSTKIVQRIQKNEIAFKEEYVAHVKEYAQRLDDKGFPIPVERKKEFIHLSKFDENIYNAINNDRKKIKHKKLLPSEAVKRKNLSPMIIYTTMKEGYNSKSKDVSRMFESSTTSPNPIDLFKLFQYIKVSRHVETKSKPRHKASNTSLPINEQLIRYGNLEYLGTFGPKKANNMEASLLLHFNMPKENVVYRNKNYKDIFIAELESEPVE